jgi:hypothetical protein
VDSPGPDAHPSEHQKVAAQNHRLMEKHGKAAAKTAEQEAANLVKRLALVGGKVQDVVVEEVRRG